MNYLRLKNINRAIFDMDGTLFDTERLGMQMWSEAIKRLNAPLNEEFKRRIIGVNRATSAAIAKEMFGENSMFNEAAALSSKLFCEAIERDGVPFKSGAKEALGYLYSKGIKMAVATSTSKKSAENTLKKADIYKYFGAFAFGDEVLKGKPEPDIFLLAAKRLDTDITRCAVVEDSPNGIKAAKKSGAFVVAVPDIVPLDEYAEYYDIKISSLNDIIGLL